MEQSPFSLLSVEMVSRILHFLTYKDIQKARLVCKLFYKASLSFELVNNEILYIGPDNPQELSATTEEQPKLILNCNRHFYNVTIVDNSNVWFNMDLWRKIGPELRTLHLNKCKFYKKYFKLALSCCPLLKFLHVRRCEELVPSDDYAYYDDDEVEMQEYNDDGSPRGSSLYGSMRRCYYDSAGNVEEEPEDSFPTLQNLLILKIAGFGSVNLSLFNAVVDNAPNLKTVILIKATKEANPPPGSFSCSHVAAGLSRRSDKEYKLILYHDETVRNQNSIDSIHELISLRNVRLKVLRVSYCPPEFYTCLTPQLSLRRFDLVLKENEGVIPNDAMIEIICSNFPFLEELRLDKLIFVTSAIRLLGRLKNLTRLALLMCVNFDQRDFMAALCSEVNTTLKHLTLSHVEGFTPKFFIELARTHPALLSLDLTNCDGLDDWSIQAIFKYQRSLQYLRIELQDWPESITDLGLGGGLFCGPLNEDETENPTGNSFARLKGLQSLHLINCPITGSAFTRDARFPNLREVNFTNTKVTFKKNCAFFKRNTRIRHLNLSRSPITDGLINKLMDNLLDLREICLGGRNDFFPETFERFCERNVLVLNTVNYNADVEYDDVDDVEPYDDQGGSDDWMDWMPQQ